MARMRAGQAVIEALRVEGVDHIFGIVGWTTNSIVLNNNCHGAEKAQQQRHFDERYIGVDLVNPRFDRLAEVYGARGFYVRGAPG